MDNLKYDISYKRTLEHNYMVIKGDDSCNESVNENYRYRMLSENSIDKILKLELKMNNGIYDFYYETSGMQPMSRVYEHREIKSEDLINLINEIENAYTNAFEYMLTPNHFILNPKYMYMNLETKTIRLLYYPAYDETVENAFYQLAEYILDKVDHQDSSAVMMAYQLYKIIREGTFTIRDLRKVVDEGANNKYDAQSELYNSNDNYDMDDVLVYSEEDREDNYDDNYNDSSSSITKSSKGLFGGLFSIGRNNKSKTVPVNEKSIDNEKSNILPYKSDKEFEFNRNSSDAEECMYGKTVMLVPERGITGRSLVQIVKGKEVTYELDKLPISIGKVADMVDIVLKDATVSKLHAEIMAENETIYIKDCNSTNGTFVNGMQLDAEEKISLEIGDEISIGKVKLEYR